VVAIAITRLAKHEGSISLFVRFVKNYFVFYSLQDFSEPASTSAGNPWDRRATAALWAGRVKAILITHREQALATKIGILIVEDDEGSQSALRQVLDSEGWYVRIVPFLSDALAELSSGEWSLVILNIAMTGLSGPVYLTLRELALAPAVEEGMVRARVLFLVPEAHAPKVQPALEKDRLPYVLKPFQFNDFLEKVSDLLMETDALASPIRQVRHDASAAARKLQERRAGHESDIRQGRRDTGMFAKREDYVMTEEEIADYEKSEQAEREQKRKTKEPLQR
jgi:DNA-binding response OmpR family regulator